MSPLDSVPAWCDSIDDWRRYILNSQGKATNFPTVGNAGQDVHIGIIDTVKTLPEDHPEATIANEESVLHDVDESWTANHGIEVFDIARGLAPNATFSFIQAARSDHSIGIDAYYEAIEKSIEIGVDIINISADNSSVLPVHASPVCKYTQLAIDEDIIVIGAIGNWHSSDKRPPIGYPAAMDEVVGVGGFVSKCPRQEQNNDAENDQQGPYYAERVAGEDYPPLIAEGFYCGRNRCCDGKECILKSFEQEWEQNPLPTGGGPDILAPVHYPRTTANDVPYIAVGTSYATPIVSAAVALAYEECYSQLAKEPNHYHTIEALNRSSVPVDSGEHHKLNTTRLLNEMKSVVK